MSRLYEEIGRRPMTEAELEQAISWYAIDHGGTIGEAAEAQLRSLNRLAWTRDARRVFALDAPAAAAAEQRRARGGRPPRLTDIKNDDGLRLALAELRRSERKTTRATLAAEAGYTFHALVGYLEATGRTFAQLIEDLELPAD